MFSLFRKKYKPEQIAAELWDAINVVAVHIVPWTKAIQPSDSERDRLELCVWLLPMVMSHQICGGISDEKLKQAVGEAHEILFKSFREKDELLIIGDFVIWNHERQQVARVLREKYLQPVTAELLASHKVRKDLLLRVLTEVRKETAINDFSMATTKSSGGRHEEIFKNFCEFAATSLSKQVIRFDALNPNLTQNEADRMLVSVAHVRSPIGYLYMRIIEILRSV